MHFCDPFESWEHAQSEAVRRKTAEWYHNTFRPRVWEKGCIILIMTRWHEDDLAGRLLAEQAGEWTVLRLPALAETQEERDENNRRLHQPQGIPDPLGREPGQPLCPSRYSKPALLALQTDVGSLGWTAEYQGVPRNAEGNRFKRPWFPIVDAIPATIKKRVRYWDKAATENGGCYTAGVLMDKAGAPYWIAIPAAGIVSLGFEVFGRYAQFSKWDGSLDETDTTRTRAYLEGSGWYSDVTDTQTYNETGSLWFYKYFDPDFSKNYAYMQTFSEAPAGDSISAVRKASLNLNTFGIRLTLKVYFNVN